MAKKMTLQEKLAAARSGTEASEHSPAPTPSVTPATPEVPSAAQSSAPQLPAEPASAPTGRSLTLKEKLAAARSGGAGQPPTVPTPAPDVPDREAPTSSGSMTLKEKLAAARSGGQTPPPVAPVESQPVPPSAPAPVPAGSRPLSLKEKLAAARGSAPSPSPTSAPPTLAVDAEPSRPRTLPTLDQMSSPRDFAEALHRESARRADSTRRADTMGAANARPPAVRPPGPGRTARPDLTTRQGALAGLTVVASVVLGWVILVAGLAGAGFILIHLLASNPPV